MVHSSGYVGICVRKAANNYLLNMANRTLKTYEVVKQVEGMLTACDHGCMYWKGIE